MQLSEGGALADAFACTAQLPHPLGAQQEQEPVSKPPPLISAIWSRGGGGAAIRERAPSGWCQLNQEASAQAECALAVARHQHWSCQCSCSLASRAVQGTGLGSYAHALASTARGLLLPSG
ncbi:hypothetical protein GcC1_184001 [Golovinomyces cichoracearum]|uniref:Uncharacterized protein n=1 Tax=Golovinomyces cichoracearum TaxID=62708 RepID=A0A420HL84_9PEZI|nr:hypothetical protein GcC1_184001 [Golovinomyces cichoracearum]